MKKAYKVLEFLPLFSIILMIIVIFISLGLILNQYIILFFSILPLLIFIILFVYYSIKNEKESIQKTKKKYV